MTREEVKIGDNRPRIVSRDGCSISISRSISVVARGSTRALYAQPPANAYYTSRRLRSEMRSESAVTKKDSDAMPVLWQVESRASPV